MKNYLLIIFSLLITNLYCQEKVKFKKISKEILLEKSCYYEDGVAAEYLYHSVTMRPKYNKQSGLSMVYYIHDRIKIYTKEGFEKADQKIYLRSDKKEGLSNLNAYTYYMENGKVKNVKLDKENIYKEEENEFYNSISFAMPAVKEGVILEIKYRIDAEDSFNTKRFYFQEDIPVRYALFDYQLPDFYTYIPQLQGLIPLNREAKRSSDTNFDLKGELISGREIKAIEEEDFVHSMNNYKSAIDLELSSINYKYEPIRHISKTWNNVANIIQESSSVGQLMSVSVKQYNDFLSNISQMSDRDKAIAIYNQVKNDITWDQTIGIVGRNNNFNKVIKDKEGSSAEINLLLLNLLRKAGIKANLVVYKTRNSGYLNFFSPTLIDLNYSIVKVYIGESYYLLDATDKKLPFGFLPARSLNLNAVEIEGNTGKKFEIINPNISKSINFYNLSLQGDKLIGQVKSRIKGYSAYKMRKEFNSPKDIFEKSSNNYVKLSNFELKHFNKLDEALIFTSDLEISDNVHKIDDKIFVTILDHLDDFSSPFIAENRLFPVIYDSKDDYQFTISIDIPEGYIIESLPENSYLTIPNDDVKLIIEYKGFDDKISIMMRKESKSVMIYADNYEFLKEFHEILESKVKEKIVLTKV